MRTKHSGEPAMSKNNLMNLRMNSFASFDDALDMCELLSRETGDEYTVMPDNYLGFTANRIQSSIKKSNNNNVIDTSDFSKGVYFIRLISGNKSVVKKIIKS